MRTPWIRCATLAFVSLACAVVARAGPLTQPTDVEGVEATVLEAKRGEGDTVMVKWQLENRTREKKRMTEQRTGWYDVYRLSADAYFLDNAGRTKYPVVRTPDRVPVAAKYGHPNEWAVIPPGKKVSLWAKFNAPPPDVHQIELHLPAVDLPFEGVDLR